jgi:hypothetical protein
MDTRIKLSRCIEDADREVGQLGRQATTCVSLSSSLEND